MKRFLVPAVVLLASLGNAPAQTPDGETPSNEGVCDVLKADGVTRALYGLCVAFCEAQDCDGLDMTRGPPCKSGERILRNYNSRMTATDPPMPCLLDTGCMCFDLSEAVAIPRIDGPPEEGFAHCWREGAGYHADARIRDWDDPSGASTTLATIHLWPDGQGGFSRIWCWYYDNTSSRPVSRNVEITNPTADEIARAWVCYETLVEACRLRGDCYQGAGACPQ